MIMRRARMVDVTIPLDLLVFPPRQNLPAFELSGNTNIFLPIS
jgi:hypothetical protein